MRPAVRRVPARLGTFSEASSQRAREQLQELGVDVCTGSLVTAVEPGRIKVGDAWIATDVTLWATGVAASPLGQALGVEPDRAGRVRMAPDLSVSGHRELFVIGDMSALTDVNGHGCRAWLRRRYSREQPWRRISSATCAASRGSPSPSRPRKHGDHRTSSRGGRIRRQAFQA